MSQHCRFPGGFLIVAAILSIPTMLYSIAYAVQKADTRCAEKGLTVEERQMCE